MLIVIIEKIISERIISVTGENRKAMQKAMARGTSFQYLSIIDDFNVSRRECKPYSMINMITDKLRTFDTNENSIPPIKTILIAN
jgi:hypothetical protein